MEKAAIDRLYKACKGAEAAGNTAKDRKYSGTNDSPIEDWGCQESRATHSWLGQVPAHKKEEAGRTDRL